jgi:hypothetical protein
MHDYRLESLEWEMRRVGNHPRPSRPVDADEDHPWLALLLVVLMLVLMWVAS